MKKYSQIDELVAVGFLVNAMGGGGDRGQAFPRSDAEDLSRGLRFIPGEVTMARRDGDRVEFFQGCDSKCCWFWEFPDGSRTYYWERHDFEQIARVNGKEKDEKGFYGDVGRCPQCGNVHTSGGYIKKEEG